MLNFTGVKQKSILKDCFGEITITANDLNVDLSLSITISI